MREISKFEKLEFQLTSACNMRCTFCFNDDGLKTQILSPELICNVIKNILYSNDPSAGLNIVWLTGGEPLLEKECGVKVIQECNSLGLYCGLSTNGLLLSRYAKELSAAGLDEVRVSLDSTKAQVFDSIRGMHGSFSKVIEGICSSIEAGLKTSLRFTITNENFQEAENVVRLAPKLGVSMVELKAVLPIGRAHADMMVHPRSLEKTFTQAVMAGGNRTRVVAMCNYLPFCEEFSVRPNIACICGSSSAYVACNGAIIPCSYFPHESEFNIHNHSILDALKGPLFEQMRNAKPEKCVTCEKWDSCRNGCPALLHIHDRWGEPCFTVVQELQKKG